MLKAKIQKNNSGFSLVEIIIVTAIVTLAFMGIMSLVRQTIMLRSVNQDNLIAGQLAAEGIELVKNVRNENWLQQNDFYQNISNNMLVKDCYYTSTKSQDCDYFTIDYFSRPGYVVGADLIPEEFGRTDILFRDANSNVLTNGNLKGDESKLNIVTDQTGRVFYSHLDTADERIASSTPTIFHRIIRTTLHKNYGGTGVDMLEVQARVYWQNRGKDNYYDLSAELYDYDWYY